MSRKLTKAELELLTAEERKELESLLEEEIEEQLISDGLSFEDAYIHWNTFLRGYGAQLSGEKIYHLISKELLFIYTRVPLEKHMPSGTYAIENYGPSQLEQFFIDYDVHIERRSLRELLEIETENMPGDENYFIRKGDYWEVGFAGETTTLKDSKGLRTVVALLKSPNHEFYPLDLQQVVEGFNEDLSDEEKETRDNHTDLSQGKDENGISLLQKKEHLSLNAMPIERLFEDEEERERFEKMINEVWERTTGNDSTEWGQLKEYLLNEKGVRLWYTPRGPVYKYLGRLDDDSEKARKTISSNIKKFKEKIKDKIPSLKNHLDRHIATGNKFIYIADPTDPISWQIKD